MKEAIKRTSLHYIARLSKQYPFGLDKEKQNDQVLGLSKYVAVFVNEAGLHIAKTNFFRNDDYTVFLIGHITEIFHYFCQNKGCYSEDRLLKFAEKQTKHSYVVRLQRYVA